MLESTKTMVALLLAITILFCCKTNSTISEDEYSGTELMVSSYDDNEVESPTDTIPDSIPDEPEFPEEEPDEEPDEDPDEDPEPIPDTLMYWLIK